LDRKKGNVSLTQPKSSLRVKGDRAELKKS